MAVSHEDIDGTTPTGPPANDARTPSVGLGARRAVWIAVVYFMVQVILGGLIGIGVAVYLGIRRGIVDSASVAEAIGRLTLPISVVAALVGGWMAFRMVRRSLPGSIGSGALTSLGWSASPRSEWASATVIGFMIALGYVFLLVPINPPTEDQAMGPVAAAASAGGWQLHLYAVFTLLLAPPIEEFVFRGVLFQGLSNKIGVGSAAVIVTVVFTSLHATETLAYWPAWVAIALLATTTVLLRLRTRSLLPPIGAHFGYNLCIVLATYVGTAQ